MNKNEIKYFKAIIHSVLVWGSQMKFHKLMWLTNKRNELLATSGG